MERDALFLDLFFLACLLVALTVSAMLA